MYSICLYMYSSLTFECLNQYLWNLAPGTWAISTAYSSNLSNESVRLYVYPLIVAEQESVEMLPRQWIHM
jgi:hypothetical protein